MGQKQKRIRQKEPQDYAEEQERRKKEKKKKWVQTDSPEIPDRRETSEISGLPSGEMNSK